MTHAASADLAEQAGDGAAESVRPPRVARWLQASAASILICLLGAYALSEVHRTAPLLEDTQAKQAQPASSETRLADSGAGTHQPISASEAYRQTNPTNTRAPATGAEPTGARPAPETGARTATVVLAPGPLSAGPSTAGNVALPSLDAGSGNPGAVVGTIEWSRQILPPTAQESTTTRADPLGAIIGESSPTLFDAAPSPPAAPGLPTQDPALSIPNVPARAQEGSAGGNPADKAPQRGQADRLAGIAGLPATKDGPADGTGRTQTLVQERSVPNSTSQVERLAGSSGQVPGQTPSAGAALPLETVQDRECASLGFFARMSCNERIRNRFCANRWGQHPDCVRTETASNL